MSVAAGQSSSAASIPCRRASRHRRFSRLFPGGALVVATLALAAAGMGTAGAQGRSSRSGAAASGKGSVNVAYAGSLQFLNEKVVGPQFSTTTGYGYAGEGSGSYAVAKEIVAHEIFPNVFVSVGSGPINELRPTYTRWAVEFAADPLVIAFNAHSRYASALEAVASGKQPLAKLFDLLATPGFRLGRTDPSTDPQGQGFVMMMEAAQATLHLPTGTASRILGPLENPSQIFAETALESFLEAGQLDAASAYRAQAIELHLDYITLPNPINFGEPADAASYARYGLTLPSGKKIHGTPLVLEVTTVGTPTAPGEAFVRFLLSSSGRTDLRQSGFTLLAPRLLGSRTMVPAAVRASLPA
ncbi:MAG: tungstate/molybdate binding protein [Acidimicrobiaceae bacterium]|nr:tungstate/molybdate binding protein [Acidimicrobiaceae bacterium]